MIVFRCALYYSRGLSDVYRCELRYNLDCKVSYLGFLVRGVILCNPNLRLFLQLLKLLIDQHLVNFEFAGLFVAAAITASLTHI